MLLYIRIEFLLKSEVRMLNRWEGVGRGRNVPLSDTPPPPLGVGVAALQPIVNRPGC